MKKILNEWRKFLIKENEEKLKEFYHGTTFPMESFIKGIDAKRSKGHGQGAGFYVFTEKAKAIEHVKGLASGEIYKGMDGGDSSKGEPIIVVISPPLTPQNFDIDYEVFGEAYIKFVIDNKEYFHKNRLNLGVGSHRPEDKRFIKRAERGKVKFRGKDRTMGMTVPLAPVQNVLAAQKIGESAELLSQFDPAMHKKFEEQVLSKATGLKYNGKEKIIPIRIENIEGKVLWKKS